MLDPVELISHNTSTIPPAKPVRSLFMEGVMETRTDSLQYKSVRKSAQAKVSLRFLSKFDV